MDQISKDLLKKYFLITEEALAKVKSAPKNNIKQANNIIDMAERYFSDAKHFEKIGDSVTAFAALNYAHGWLDAGAVLNIFSVKDSRLFTVDE